MPFEFKLPDLGEGIHEAQVLAWKVAPGQEVAAFQPLVEVESAKAAVELTAPVAGRVIETRFAEGTPAQLGDVVGGVGTARNESAPPPSATVHAATERQEWFGSGGSPPRVQAAPPPQVQLAPRKVL